LKTDTLKLEERELAFLASIEIGRTPSRTNPAYWNGHQKWITISDYEHGDVITNTKERITQRAVNECGIRVHSAGTLIMSFKLTIGKLAILGEPMATNEAITALKPFDAGVIDERFLFHYLSQYNFDALVDRAAKGQTLNKAKLSQILIRFPGDLVQQRRIAAILDKADAINRKRDQAIGLADDFLRSWFLETFGDPRKIENGHLLLGDIATIERGRFSPRPRNDPRFYGGDFPFIQTGEIANSDGYLTNYRQTLNKDGTRVSKSFPKGTVFVAIVGATIGATAISSREFWCPDSVIGIGSKSEDYPPEFIEYLLRFWRPIFVAQAPETARANINLQTLKPVPIPRVKNGDAKQFGHLYREVHAMKAKLREADSSLFHSLSQRAFSGEL
jgi:type I restriction enzyme S subunit